MAQHEIEENSKIVDEDRSNHASRESLSRLAFAGMDETADQFKDRMSQRPQVTEQHQKKLVDIDALFENQSQTPEIQIKQGQALDFVRRNGASTDYSVEPEADASRLLRNNYPNGIAWSAREEFAGLDIKKEFIARSDAGHGSIDVTRLNRDTNAFDSKIINFEIVK